MAVKPIRVGEIYKHFKRETVDTSVATPMYLYEIKAIAQHTERDEKLVIYQALYADEKQGVKYTTYARPYAMFVEKVDKKKYPNIKQVHRFERWDCDNNE